MTDDLTPHLEAGRRVLARMSASPCEFIETAFSAEKHALEVSGAERGALRAAVQSIDAADTWTPAQREAFVAYVGYLEERIS